MTIKNRIKRLEATCSNTIPVLPPLFVSFGGEDTEWAIVPGHNGELRKQEGENLGEFCQRVYQAYVQAKGLEHYGAEELSDDDLKFVEAASSPCLALKLHREKELLDADIQSAIDS